ncbi:MAG TPA: hypothetical protein VI386_11795 [Candidatus Sulfotelmatobacter sp.]
MKNNKPAAKQPTYQIVESPISTIDTGTESCSEIKDGVLVTVRHEIFSAPVTE